MISPLNFCLPGYFNEVKYRRPAGEPAGPNFAPHTPYANFFLTRAAYAALLRIPETQIPSAYALAIFFFFPPRSAPV